MVHKIKSLERKIYEKTKEIIKRKHKTGELTDFKEFKKGYDIARKFGFIGTLPIGFPHWIAGNQSWLWGAEVGAELRSKSPKQIEKILKRN